VYGADAFAGVINIVTKTASDIDGVEVGSRLGRFDTRDVWALYGKKIGEFDVALIAEWGETDGHDEKVNSDAATVFGTSLAPGPVNTEVSNLDVRLDISTGNWQFRAGLQNRDDVGLGAGIADALTPSTYDSDRWNADLTYHNLNFTNWDIQAQVSYFDTSQESDELIIFPPGTFGLPNGLISTPQIWERHHRYNVTTLFTGFNEHSIRTGLGFTRSEIYKIEEQKNLGAGVAVPGVLTDVTDTPFSFLPEEHRNNIFAFIQDVWQISNDWELTAGLRYDDYDDFGDTWNPRLALVWAARYDLTAKLIYGEAFRAPSFGELLNRNNPVNLGNSELNPEEIKTLELAFDYRPKDNLRLGLNLFGYEWDNIIRLVSSGGGTNTAQNAGQQEGYGFEFEFDWKLSRTFSLLGNYAYQNSEDQATNQDAGNAPENQFYVRTNWEFLPDWHITPQWNFVLDRKRPPGDPRDDIGDYNILDLTLRHTSFSGRWEVAVSGRNILDEHAFEPASTSIPNDLPLAGRAFWGELRFNY
jgi:iron complex outermembrane receptor protein